MTKKKLAILIISLRGGGAERVVSILLNSLHSLYDVHLVLMSRDIVYEIPDNITIHYLTDKPASEGTLSRIMNLPVLAYKYFKLARRLGFQVSLSFMYRPNFINVLAAKLGMKARVLISERNNPSEQHPLFKLLVRKLYPLADAIIPNAEGMAHELKSRFGIPAEKVQVIHNPVNLNQLKPSALVDPQPGKPFRFVTLGRLNQTKNQVLLVEAMGRLKHHDCTLDIIGEGDQRPVIEAAIKKHGLEQRVNLLGFKDKPHSYMAGANSFVYASNFEGFPNVLIEAMAIGLPVITTDCRFGPREILHPDNPDYSQPVTDVFEAGNGILVPMNNVEKMVQAMQRMMEDRKFREKMGLKSQERARAYDQDKIISQFRAIIG